MKAIYYMLPDAVAYMPLPDGRADVWLRKGVSESEDDEGSVCWECEEVYLRTTLSRDDVVAMFDELFDSAEQVAAPIPTVDDRVRDLELQVEEQAGAIEELALMMVGGE
ncbi:hypothetical protein [Adlercreutzia sp. ZJ141]|uniref:hypothetical protein n=1 Tax=Adlercreutzia sp. ZJ141 TaxID=2709406 RepID=UPI0013EBFE01|nr:hypothetical protein [Adlercreutzia sp. ZJ141]